MALIGVLSILVVPLIIGSFSTDLETGQSLCPFKMLTGFPCPGCGITKSIFYFFEGDFAKSLTYHLFGPAVVGFSISLILLLTVELFTGREYARPLLFHKTLGLGAAIALGTYHTIRLAYFIHAHTFSEILHESIWN